jgi:hypothetical protein
MGASGRDLGSKFNGVSSKRPLRYVMNSDIRSDGMGIDSCNQPVTERREHGELSYGTQSPIV